MSTTNAPRRLAHSIGVIRRTSADGYRRAESTSLPAGTLVTEVRAVDPDHGDNLVDLRLPGDEAVYSAAAEIVEWQDEVAIIKEAAAHLASVPGARISVSNASPEVIAWAVTLSPPFSALGYTDTREFATSYGRYLGVAIDVTTRKGERGWIEPAAPAEKSEAA